MLTIPPRTRLVKLFTLTALITPLWAGSALAWTGGEVVNRLQNLLKEQHTGLTFANADVDGRTVILRDAKVQFLVDDKTDDGSSSPLNLGDITLSGITEAADGAYIIDNVVFPDTKIIEDDTVFTTKGIRIEKLKLSEQPKIDLLGRMEYLEGFYADEISVANKDVSLININDLYLTNQPYSQEKASQFSWGFKALNLNLEEINRVEKEKKALNAENDAEAGDDESDATDIAGETSIEDIRALGLEKLQLSMATTGSWSPYSGEYIIDSLAINGQEIGNFSYKLHMGGYDLKFIKAIQDLYGSILQEGTDNTAMQMAALGMLQNLSITNMEMRYDNAEFVNKILELEAGKKSLSREAYVTEIKQELQQAVDYFAGEPVVAAAVTAIGDFLDAPQSISLQIKPDQPVNFAILTAVGMADPKKLWSVLGVLVEANK